MQLLGKECCDIDIALNNISGREFCKKVNDYLSAIEEEDSEIVDFPSNPDKSKHLDTARMTLFDISVDFVNLRAEDYSQNSRIPTMVNLSRINFASCCLLKAGCLKHRHYISTFRNLLHLLYVK